MQQDLKHVITEKVRSPLAEYNKYFSQLVKIRRSIDEILTKDTELLSEIRRKFSNLSATVELEFEGASVYNQEIKKTKGLIEQSIIQVNDSVSISNRISDDLNSISGVFDRIHACGVHLEDIIKNINTVSDSIEVASRNAGITAFHAGKLGRGFEVIAREMTALVKSVQNPTQIIPRVSGEIIRGMVELGHNLLTINNLMHEVREKNTKFTGITDEFLALIPNVETGLMDVGKSIEIQKELHNLLLKENEKSAKWIEDIYDFTRSSTILEISLEMIFRQVNNSTQNLIEVEDNSAFVAMYRSLKLTLEHLSRKYNQILGDLVKDDFGKLIVPSSERSILKLVSESNQFSQVIQNIAQEIANWSKTNRFARETLTDGLVLYQKTIQMLNTLNNKLIDIRSHAYTIEQPLNNLKKITERAKVLGLYAAIESGRGGEYAVSLGEVTQEIKHLSEKTNSFVEKIIDVSNDMTKSFSQLASLLVKSTSDVEQGIGSLQLGIDIVKENQTLLGSLTDLSDEMIESTAKMKVHCGKLSEHIRDLNHDYGFVSSNFKKYADTIRNSAAVSGQVYDVLKEYQKDVFILKRKRTEIVFRQSIGPIILDPANRTDTISTEVIDQIFDGLYCFDNANHVVPGIADSFSVSKDGCTWDFVLKQNVLFHDGTPVTARDVADTIARVKQGTNAGAIDYIDEVCPLDNQRIRFLLKFPYLPFLANIACGVCDVVPRHFQVDNIIGCGPYCIVRWDKGKEVILESYQEYHGSESAINKAVMKVIPDHKEALLQYKKGEIDVMAVTHTIISEVPPEELFTGPTLSTQYVDINVLLDTPFKNKKVRQAMNYVIDKEYYANILSNKRAIPAHGVIPPGMYVYNDELVGYELNIDKAKTLMEEAGYGRGLDGTYPFDFTGGEVGTRKVEYIKQCLAKIGIKIELNVMPWEESLERSYDRKSILSLRSWTSDNGDPDNFFFPLFHTKNFGRSGNTSFYSNPEVDDMIEVARSERNSKKRCGIYREAEQKIVDDAPWIFLTHGVATYAVKKRIGGFKVDPFGFVRFRYLWCS